MNHGDSPVAAVVTVYTPNGRPDVIVGKILEGYQQDGGLGLILRLHLFIRTRFSTDGGAGAAKLPVSFVYTHPRYATR